MQQTSEPVNQPTQGPTPQLPTQQPQKIKITKEMYEAEKRADEELMRQAMEMSLKEDQEKKQMIDLEEEEIMKRVIEMSEREEKERMIKAKDVETIAAQQIQKQPVEV